MRPEAIQVMREIHGIELGLQTTAYTNRLMSQIGQRVLRYSSRSSANGPTIRRARSRSVSTQSRPASGGSSITRLKSRQLYRAHGSSFPSWFAINDTTFAVLERDNQKLNNSRVKRIYTFSIAGLTPVPAGGTPPTVTKTLVRDLLRQDGFHLEKTEGMVLTPLGDYIVASDNDGGGETQVFTV